MRAIGYFRSKDGQTSPEEFEEAFAEYCDFNLHQPVQVFADAVDPESSEGNEYRRLVDYLHDSGSSFLIVVPDAGHLGDDLESVVRSIVELQKADATVTCADEELPDPLQNALQTLGVRGVSLTRSSRIKESMRERAMSGRGLGRTPFGYRTGLEGTLEVVRQEASVIELIYRLYTEDGLGLRLIAQELNGRGIPTRRGGRWHVVTIRDILKNPTYMGTYTRFGLRLTRSHEAIVSPELFRMAQNQTAARRPRGRVANSEPFLLSGLVYCASCGNKMMGVTRRQTWRRKDGRRARGVYRYYQCQSRNNLSMCGYHTWRAPLLEGTVMSQLRHQLRSRPSSRESGGREGRAEELSSIWEGRVRNAERRFLQAARRAARAQLSIERLAGYLDELDDARRRAGLAGRPVNVEEVFANWDALPLPDRQSFLLEQVRRIVVDDDAAEIVI